MIGTLCQKEFKATSFSKTHMNKTKLSVAAGLMGLVLSSSPAYASVGAVSEPVPTLNQDLIYSHKIIRLDPTAREVGAFVYFRDGNSDEVNLEYMGAYQICDKELKTTLFHLNLFPEEFIQNFFGKLKPFMVVANTETGYKAFIDQDLDGNAEQVLDPAPRTATPYKPGCKNDVI